MLIGTIKNIQYSFMPHGNLKKGEVHFADLDVRMISLMSPIIINL
jgi:hypothetical protein